MAGNVWEWVEDKFDDKEAARVLRGGTWSSYARNLRASNRFGGDAGGRGSVVGFRVCCVSPIEKPVIGALTTEPPKR